MRAENGQNVNLSLTSANGSKIHRPPAAVDGARGRPAKTCPRSRLPRGASGQRAHVGFDFGIVVETNAEFRLVEPVYKGRAVFQRNIVRDEW